jgi:hypothetical protein
VSRDRLALTAGNVAPVDVANPKHAVHRAASAKRTPKLLFYLELRRFFVPRIAGRARVLRSVARSILHPAWCCPGPLGQHHAAPPPLDGWLVLRTILLLSLLLLAVGSFAAVVEPTRPIGDSTRPGPPRLEWVRTTAGWERPGTWQRPTPAAPKLQPFVVAGFIAMSGVAALLISPATSRIRNA